MSTSSHKTRIGPPQLCTHSLPNSYSFACLNFIASQPCALVLLSACHANWRRVVRILLQYSASPTTSAGQAATELSPTYLFYINAICLATYSLWRCTWIYQQVAHSCIVIVWQGPKDHVYKIAKFPSSQPRHLVSQSFS
jgi:hypothetical protein